ncbi:MAG: hypothetical protein EOQ95_23135 [Mesorhizobium sp.]|nr:MAG: hypothetical protein EOQ95_23135 [Mesorhizobium sp.]
MRAIHLDDFFPGMGIRATALERFSDTQSKSKAERYRGNINQRGEHIFHVPGQEYYLATQINPARGERWFCSQWEAWWAGWRKNDNERRDNQGSSDVSSITRSPTCLEITVPGLWCSSFRNMSHSPLGAVATPFLKRVNVTLLPMVRSSAHKLVWSARPVIECHNGIRYPDCFPEMPGQGCSRLS